jgi:hypothetical protein
MHSFSFLSLWFADDVRAAPSPPKPVPVLTPVPPASAAEPSRRMSKSPEESLDEKMDRLMKEVSPAVAAEPSSAPSTSNRDRSRSHDHTKVTRGIGLSAGGGHANNHLQESEEDRKPLMRRPSASSNPDTKSRRPSFASDTRSTPPLPLPPQRRKPDLQVNTSSNSVQGSRHARSYDDDSTAPSVSSNARSYDRGKRKAMDAETIRDGDFSMRSRTSGGSPSQQKRPGSKTETPGDTSDPARYSFDNWSLARQMQTGDDNYTVDDMTNNGRMMGGSSGQSVHGEGTVRVACRVRPFSVGEMQLNARRVVSMNGDRLILVNPNSFQADPDAIAAAAAAASLEKMSCSDWAKVFRFDNCLWSFDPMNLEDDTYADQLTVHEQVGQHLVRDMLSGVPVTCFAYGHTGTGKTHTMFGSSVPVEDIDSADIEMPAETGLIPRVFAEIIHGVFPPNADPDYESDTRITISFLEIHQERIRDLLDTSNGEMGDLRIREHPSIGPYVENLTRIEVKTPGEMLLLLKAGNSERTNAQTAANSSSSRSHAIVTLEMTPYDAPPFPVIAQSRPAANRLGAATAPRVPYERIRATMIDLAGSEKDFPKEETSAGGVQGMGKFKSPRTREELNAEKLELKMIRKSLSTLGYIIRSLSQGIAIRGMPFRDSSLTWLLKDSLSGHCALSMVATISPADIAYNETLNTLKYAERLCALASFSNPGQRGARKTGAVSINDTIDPALTYALASEYSRLKQELSGQSTRAARHLLKQTISDPQQRLAKLEKDEETPSSKHGAARGSSTPSAALVALSAGPAAVTPGNGAMVVAQPADSEALVQLRETYRQLHGRFIELQIELENARTDRDGLQLEMQSLKDALEASKAGASKQQQRMFLTPSADMGSALLAAEDEIAELKANIQRKDEASDRLLNELAEERQIRSTIERTAKAQVVDLIARVEALQK